MGDIKDNFQIDGNMPVANDILNIINKGKLRKEAKLDHSKLG